VKRRAFITLLRRSGVATRGALRSLLTGSVGVALRDVAERSDV